LTVKVTEKGGKQLSATVNQYGNFYYYLNQGSYSAPFTAIQVTGTNGHRDMSETAPNGQCNACHTETGKNPFSSTFKTIAPGRIMAP
jgi:hypothetical protein